MRHFQQYINGAFEDGQQSLESLNPASGEPWATVAAASASDADRAVRSAHQALSTGDWPAMTASQRGKLLHRLADALLEHAEEIAEVETADTGKIRRETSAQIRYIADYYRYFAGLADKVHGYTFALDKADMQARTVREPVGVVVAVVPWNSQMFLTAVKLGPALAAGCTVVIKASEEAAAPLFEFAKVIDQVGFPAGVVNIITGTPDECGKVVTSHPLVSKIAFTGGPATARQIIRNSAENLAATSLELGGKSPVVVFEDADVQSAANAVVAGIFAATGQSCVAGSRLLVHRSVYPALINTLVEKAKRIVIGDPQSLDTEMGPLATLRQRQRIEALVGESVNAGARLLCGGRVPADQRLGFYYEPTILDCDSGALACVQQELFGPVLSVQQFDTEEQAVEMANDSVYALASGIFTTNLARAHRMSERIRAGVVWINTYRAISPMVPFGGYGHSGLGREGGADTVLEYTRTKSIWTNTSDAPVSDPFVMR